MLTISLWWVCGCLCECTILTVDTQALLRIGSQFNSAILIGNTRSFHFIAITRSNTSKNKKAYFADVFFFLFRHRGDEIFLRKNEWIFILLLFFWYKIYIDNVFRLFHSTIDDSDSSKVAKFKRQPIMLCSIFFRSLQCIRFPKRNKWNALAHQ